MTALPSSSFIRLYASKYLFRIVDRNVLEYSCSNGEEESGPSEDDNDPTDSACIRATLSAAATEAFVGVAAHLAVVSRRFSIDVEFGSGFSFTFGK